MADYSWPKQSEAEVLGRRHSRLDGPVKVTGKAKYSFDQSLPGMLHAKLLTCPHAHARIKKLDIEPARRLPGVRAVRIIQDVGSEIQWAHDEIVAVAADSEEQARDALLAIEVEYEVLPHFVDESRLETAPEAKEPQEKTEGEPESAMAAADVVVRKTLGLPQIAHMCLEPHGQLAHWQGNELFVHASTQAVSGLPFQFAERLEVPASQVRVSCDFIGGGFGSKFNPERWGIEGAELARETGAPVRIFLDRDQEVAVAGSRPSAFAHAEIGADKEGHIVAWRSESWGSGGRPGTGATPLPYLFTKIPNQSTKHTSVPTHFAGARAWRAPNHPQACFVTMSLVDDLADRLGMDPLELIDKNLDLVPKRPEGLADTYRSQLELGAERIGWSRWRPRSERSAGPIQRGLGVSLHTWGGLGHRSSCSLSVDPDGSVTVRLGTQDLGTGTRTVVATVAAETLGLDPGDIRVEIGDSSLPQSDASGGSSTVGGVSSSTRRAALDALDVLLEKVAPLLEAQPSELVARQGLIAVASDPSRHVSFRRAAAELGVSAILTHGRNPGRGKLTSNGVGGVQFAEVSVDLETGVVTLERMVAVQDCGLVVNRKLAESQIFGGMIMGIGYALFEERIADPTTGRLLNADMEYYKLAGFSDVGRLEAHLVTGVGHEERGVIGLGEPPVISPGAAIANAVANATGVRVPFLPLTPERVLTALAEKEQA